MVLTVSESDTTLVSLGHGLKHRLQTLALPRVQTKASRLFLPEDDLSGSCDSLTTSSGSSSSTVVHLPIDENEPVDEFLRGVPQIAERSEQLLAMTPIRYTSKSIERILYVGQGEVAYAMASQADVLMSDRATTCHILALRSGGTLTSLTHLDGPVYEQCVRKMWQRHAEFHYKKATDLVDLEIHIVGGFEEETSRTISHWLLNLLADLSNEYHKFFRVTLETCAISSMNGRKSPIGRGLAINLRSGRAYLAKCDTKVAGPASCLRSVRLWSHEHSDHPRLSCIHNESSKEIVIEPFLFSSFADLDALLELPDEDLLTCSSTSPHCEEDDFCKHLRQSLIFLRDYQPARVFGRRHQPIAYRRSGVNAWQLV